MALGSYISSNKAGNDSFVCESLAGSNLRVPVSGSGCIRLENYANQLSAVCSGNHNRKFQFSYRYARNRWRISFLTPTPAVGVSGLHRIDQSHKRSHGVGLHEPWFLRFHVFSVRLFLGSAGPLDFTPARDRHALNCSRASSVQRAKHNLRTAFSICYNAFNY